MQLKGRAVYVFLAAAMVTATAAAQSDRVQYVPPAQAYRELLEESRAGRVQRPPAAQAAPSRVIPQQIPSYGQSPARTVYGDASAHQAQVEQLQAQIMSLQARLETMERTIDTYAVQVSALKSDLSSQSRAQQARFDAALKEATFETSAKLSSQIRAQVVAACAAERQAQEAPRQQTVSVQPAAPAVEKPARAETAIYAPITPDPATGGTRLPKNVPMQVTLATARPVPPVAGLSVTAPAPQHAQAAAAAKPATPALNDVILRFDDFATARNVYGSVLKAGIGDVIFKSWGDQYLLQFGRFRNHDFALRRREWIEKTTGLKADVVPVVESSATGQS